MYALSAILSHQNKRPYNVGDDDNFDIHFQPMFGGHPMRDFTCSSVNSLNATISMNLSAATTAATANK